MNSLALVKLASNYYKHHVSFPFDKFKSVSVKRTDSKLDMSSILDLFNMFTAYAGSPVKIFARE